MPPGPERDAFFAAVSKHEVPLGRMGTPKTSRGLPYSSRPNCPTS